MKRTMTKFCCWLLIAAGLMWTSATLTGCNTTEGAGEDIEDLGEGIQDAAD